MTPAWLVIYIAIVAIRSARPKRYLYLLNQVNLLTILGADFMEPHHEAKLDAHINSLSQEEREQWRDRGMHASQNEHDENHHSWKFIQEVAKWLGVAGTGAGGTFYALKLIARKLVRI